MSHHADPLPGMTRLALTLRRITFGTLIVLSTPGLADGPVAFNQWSVSNGTIDAGATCNAAGVTCTVLVQDQGMLQQQVTSASGSYIQMILTEADATGNAASLGFVSENFIPTNNLTGYDIHSQQIIRDPGQGFEQRAMIDRVPFFDANDTLVDLLHVNLQQTLIDSDIAASFNIIKDEAVLSTGEVFTGKSIDINQQLVSASATSPDGIKTAFDARIREGWKLSSANQTLLFDPFAPAGDITLHDTAFDGVVGADQTLTWLDGDSVTSIWLSQYNDELVTSAFGFQRVDNQSTDSTVSAGRFDTAAVIDPFSWNELTFGQAPTLP